jgi:hypothetical protein
MPNLSLSGWSVGLVMVLACAPAAALAQPDSAHAAQRRNDCRLAAHVLRTGHPAPKSDWALAVIPACGAEGGQALGAAFRAARASADTVALERLTRPALWLRDNSLFDAALEIGADRSASPQARVFAMRTLLWLIVPGGGVGYADLADEVGGRTRNCLGFGPSTHVVIRRGEPLPSNYEQSIRSLATRIMNDPHEPRPVRRAAACAQLFRPNRR